MTAPFATPLVLVSDVLGAINASGNAATLDAVLVKIIEESDRIQRWANRRFDERIDTAYYSVRSMNNGGDIYGRELFLGDDLKSLTTLINGDGSVVAGSEYQLLPRGSDSNGVIRKSSIKLNPYGATRWQVTGTTDPDEAISVLGVWGYGGQWRDTGANVTSGLASSAGADSFVASVALEAGMMLKIGTEYLYVNAARRTTTDVDRALNGSTAATHANATPIYRWEAAPIVTRHVKRLVLISISQDSSPLFSQLILGDQVAAVASDGNPRDILYDVEKAGLKRHPETRILGI